MTDQLPINLSEEVLDKWRSEYNLSLGDKKNYAMFMAEKAAQWGADQELEACAEWVNTWCTSRYLGDAISADVLRAARRPKPQTLNSVALQMLGTIERDAHYIPEITDTIRRALEALDD